MKFKAIATAAVIAGLGFAPAEPVHADAGDAIAGALIGGIIGHAIAKDQQKRKSTSQRRSTKSTKSTKPGISSAQREQNREVQTALNHFGYPVGTPDGSIGPKSRAAISSYQVTLGYPPTGQLTDYERQVLVTAYHRAIAGGPVVAQAAATHPMGMKGLLLLQRDEMAGLPPSQVATSPALPAPVAPVAAAAAGVMAAAPALPALMPEAPAAVAVAEPAAALPSFMGSGATQVSLASQCNKISLMTNTNGGYVKVATMTDPLFALGEQFCLARTYAMAAGEELAGKVAGFTPQQIAEQCAGFAPVMAEHVTALSLKSRDEVLAGVNGFILGSGMSPAQLSGTAKVCLGVGYTTDAMQVAVGSALLLTALGETGYAELLGHHLSQGYGATTRPELAVDWYDLGLTAIGQGKAVFAPGISDRGDVIRKAAYAVAGRADQVVPAALPQFALVPEAAPGAAPVAAQPTVAAPVLAEAAASDAAQNPVQSPAVAGAKVMLSAAKLPFLLLGN